MLKKIYKKIIIIFFSLINKKISILNKNKKFNFIRKKKIFSNIYLFEINKGKIFTNSVNDTAYLYENKLIEGPSYQYRDSKQASIYNNFVLKNGTPKFLKKINENIISLLSSGPCKHNYGHWVLEVLTRYSLISELKKKNKNDYYLVPSLKNSFQRETFKYLRINKKNIIASDKIKYIQGKKIICISHPFQHDFTKISKRVIFKTKNIFSKFKNISKINRFDKIFINRDYSHLDLSENNLEKLKNYRVLLNHKDISEYLKKKGFITLYLSKLSMADQIKIFAEAKIIVSMLGAELSNLIFCKSKTRIIEITNYRGTKDFYNISKKCGLKHSQIRLKPVYNSEIPQNGILYCPIKKIERALLNH